MANLARARDIMIRNADARRFGPVNRQLAGAAALLLGIGIILYNRWVHRERD